MHTTLTFAPPFALAFALPRWLQGAALALALALLGGCATGAPKAPTDHSLFHASNPKSILVLPPTNSTPDLRASDSVLAQVTRPLAEAGFYVLPVALVAETLKENGVVNPSEAHALPAKKLREIFGADAALYLDVSQYGTVFQLLDSNTTVALSGRVVDLKTEQTLWSNAASASSAEQNNQNQGLGLAGLLLTAVLKQVIGTVSDASHPMAGTAVNRLLSTGGDNGLPRGERSPGHISKLAATPAPAVQTVQASPAATAAQPAQPAQAAQAK